MGTRCRLGLMETDGAQRTELGEPKSTGRAQWTEQLAGQQTSFDFRTTVNNSLIVALDFSPYSDLDHLPPEGGALILLLEHVFSGGRIAPFPHAETP